LRIEVNYYIRSAEFEIPPRCKTKARLEFIFRPLFFVCVLENNYLCGGIIKNIYYVL